MIIIDFQLHMLLGLLASTILPLLVGLVTTRETNASRKAVLLAALSVLVPLVAELAQALSSGTVYDLSQALIMAFTGFLVSVGMHFGLWKPTGLADRAQVAGTGKHRA